MKTLIIQPSMTAEWFALVNDAEHSCALILGEELESYLVFLLMRFTSRPQLMTSILAIEFLQGLNNTGQVQKTKLQEVGDKCLLLTGLFPDLAKRRRVSENYYVDVGQSAYAMISNQYVSATCLYTKLSEYFQPMTLVLKTMRAHLPATRLTQQYALLNNLQDQPLIRH